MLKNIRNHFFKKKNRKSVKQSEVGTDQPKTFENPIIVDIKSAITEHPKTSYKLSKTIKEGEKVGSNSSLYSDTKKRKNALSEKNIIITKWDRVFKDYSSTYNVEISISINPKLHLKDTKSATWIKLIELLTHLLTQLKIKQSMTIFIQAQKQK